MEMAGEDWPVTLVDEYRHTEDGYVLRIKVLSVPESDSYPEGIKYRMHFGTIDGDTLLRYDNSHGVHERHSPEGIEEIDFPGFEVLYRRFKNEIDHDWEEDTQ